MYLTADGNHDLPPVGSAKLRGEPVMRSRVGIDGRRKRRAVAAVGLAMAFLSLPAGAPAQMRETVWLTTSPAGYDALANCLAKAMSGEFVTAPVVFAPPKRAAYVNVWPRARQPVDPVAAFHIEQAKDGVSRVGWQRLVDSPAGARWDAAAKTAATRCAPAGR